jgi:hypothetical protein
MATVLVTAAQLLSVLLFGWFVYMINIRRPKGMNYQPVNKTTTNEQPIYASNTIYTKTTKILINK